MESTQRAVMSHLYTNDQPHHPAPIVKSAMLFLIVQVSLQLLLSTTQQYEVEHNILMSTQTSAFIKSVQVLFQFNYATEFGGAIYVADVLGSDQQLFPKQHLPF